MTTPSTPNRPTPVSRSKSAPPTGTMKGEEEKGTEESSSLSSPKTEILMDEDEMIAQATACALQAKQELSKNKIKPPFFISSIEHNPDKQLPLGDVQQRKLIEEKLSNAKKSEPAPFGGGLGMALSIGQGESLDTNAFIVKNVKEVKEKLENLFPQNNSVSRQQHPTKEAQPQSQKEQPPTQTSKEQGSEGDTSSKMTSVFSKRSVSPQNNDTFTDTVANVPNIVPSKGASSHDAPPSSQTKPPTKTQQLKTQLKSHISQLKPQPAPSLPPSKPKPVAQVKPTLSATVWKRRSGYGKYSMNAWEKRRMDLVGSKVMYYKCTDGKGEQEQSQSQLQSQSQPQQQQPQIQEQQPQQQQQKQPQQQQAQNKTNSVSDSTILNESKSIEITPSTAPQSPTLSSNDTSTAPDSNQTKPATTSSHNPLPPETQTTNISAIKPFKKDTKKDPQMWWEQTKQNITKTMNELAIHNTKIDDDPDAPRGSIDLHKENVIVAAISDHEKSLTSVSPTPYGLSIMIKGETKWKVCFETHGEQIKWLTILTEIVIQKSVATYNQELKKSKSIETNESSVMGVSSSVGVGVGGVTITPGGVNMESFRSDPKQKDGLWNMDERYSSDKMLSFRELNNALGDDDDDDDDDDDLSYDENVDDQKSDSPDDLENFHSPKEIKSKKSEDASSNEHGFTSALPLPVEELISKGARSGHKWCLQGYNLNLVVALLNVSVVWTYITPIHWFFFPFFLFSVNILTLSVMIERETKGNKHRRSFLEKVASSFLARTMESRTKETTPIPNVESKTLKILSRTSSKCQEGVNIQSAKKPIAGTTTKQISKASDSHFVNNHEFMAWSSHPPQDVQVRSYGYLTTKKKIPSPAALYEVSNVEIFDSSMRVPEMATKVVLPKVKFDDDDEDIRWKCPDTFVVSLAIPTEAPSMMNPVDDGYGFTVTIYYRMKKATRDALKRITAPDYDHTNDISEANVDEQKRILNGVRLWEEWCQKAPIDADWQARFKLVPNVLNPKEVGLPSWIGKYCGKPVLIKRRGKTGFLSTHPELSAFEFDVSLHVFPYLAKKAMAYLKEKMFEKAMVSLTYVIEARSNQELPEVLIGDPVKIYYPNPDIVINANDFFAGTAPKAIKLD